MEEETMKTVLVGLLSILLLSACGETLRNRSGETRPTWMDKTTYRHDGRRYYVGRSPRSPAQDIGRQMALHNALKAMAEEVGLAVGNPPVFLQIEVNGNVIKAVELQDPAGHSYNLEGLAVAGEYWEEWRRKEGPFDVSVLVSFPEEALASLAREREGRALVVYRCRIAPSTLCQGWIAEPIAAALQKKGITLSSVPQIITQKDSPLELGRKAGAGRVVVLDVEAQLVDQGDGEYIAKARAGIDVLSTRDGSTLEHLEAGPITGGQYSEHEAIKSALGAALQDLLSRMAYPAAP